MFILTPLLGLALMAYVFTQVVAPVLRQIHDGFAAVQQGVQP